MIDRRLFLQGLSASAIAVSQATAFQNPASQLLAKAEADAARQIAPTKDTTPVRLGIIGPGSRGKELVRSFLRVPGVTIAAAADVYPVRFEELNRVCGYEVPAYADFRSLLERKDLDAIVVSTPLGLHAEHILPALAAGHHVYGEKTMAYTVEDARKIVAAATEGKRIFQVGHQYRYTPWVREAILRVHQGEIGDVTHMMAYWHRNNNWRRPVPDPSLERLINWRLYHQWSLGLIAELGSHHMDIANWVFGSTPTAALASGSICKYRDGRETDDNVQVVLNYSEGRRLIFTSLTDNAKMGGQFWVYGTKGSLNVTLEDATFFYEPAQLVQPKAAAKGVEKGVITSASYLPGTEMPYRGPGKAVDVTTAEDPTTTATRAFIYCVRTGTEPISNVHTGLGSALAVVQADQARRLHKEVEVPALVL
jgi:predicted dehydrogenase